MVLEMVKNKVGRDSNGDLSGKGHGCICKQEKTFWLKAKARATRRVFGRT